MEELLNEIKRKKLFFTVTTGRSGTHYLSYILSLLKGFKSEHEARPAFHDFYRDILDEKLSFNRFWIEYKLPYIAAQKELNYSDVSHVACKGFFESILELGIKPSFIFLKRKNREVAKSLLELGTIPLRTRIGLKYLSSPQDKGVIKIKGDLNELTDYQLCYWYTLDIDRRAAFYQNLFIQKKCSYAIIKFEELIKDHPLIMLRESIDLPRFSFTGYIKYLKNKRKPSNQKSFSKKTIEDIECEKEELELKKRLYED